jgi:hypothetical protein
MNRRHALQTAAAVSVAAFWPRALTAQEATPAAGSYPELVITATEAGFEFPPDPTAGRYAVSVVNAAELPLHAQLGRLPEGMTIADAERLHSEGSDEEWASYFLDAVFPGLPDWLQPGETRTGIADLPGGDYLIFDPFFGRSLTLTITGEGELGEEPASDLTIEMADMEFVFPAEGLRAGPMRWKIANTGAFPHEMHVVPVPEGTTVEHVVEVIPLDEGDPVSEGNPLVDFWTTYGPVAATSLLSVGRTSWIDVDLLPGTYALLCLVGVPDFHALEGMVEIVTLI